MPGRLPAQRARLGAAPRALLGRAPVGAHGVAQPQVSARRAATPRARPGRRRTPEAGSRGPAPANSPDDAPTAASATVPATSVLTRIAPPPVAPRRPVCAHTRTRPAAPPAVRDSVRAYAAQGLERRHLRARSRRPLEAMARCSTASSCAATRRARRRLRHRDGVPPRCSSAFRAVRVVARRRLAPSMVEAARERLGERRACECASPTCCELDLERAASTRSSRPRRSTGSPTTTRCSPRLRGGAAARRAAGRPVRRLGQRRGGDARGATSRARASRSPRTSRAGAGPWRFASPAETEARLRRPGSPSLALATRTGRCDRRPAEYFATIMLGSHLERLPDELHDAFVERCSAALRGPVGVATCA